MFNDCIHKELSKHYYTPSTPYKCGLHTVLLKSFIHYVLVIFISLFTVFYIILFIGWIYLSFILCNKICLKLIVVKESFGLSSLIKNKNQAYFIESIQYCSMAFGQDAICFHMYSCCFQCGLTVLPLSPSPPELLHSLAPEQHDACRGETEKGGGGAGEIKKIKHWHTQATASFLW